MVDAQCASLVHRTQVPAGPQAGELLLVQWASEPHCAQTFVVGLQRGVRPPPSTKQSLSVEQPAMHVLPMHIDPAAQFELSRHPMHLPAGSPCMVARRSHVLLVTWLAQSLSARHWTQRLLGASQTVLPVGLVEQVVVPQVVEQVLLDVLHVAPSGQWVLSRH
jgi:hypothetical protein